MTRDAILWRRLVEENSFCGNDFRQLMALPASHFLMRAAQGERSSLFMVKQRGLPLHAVVALGAAGGFATGKLFSMDIRVAILALVGSCFEIGVHQFGFEIRRLVAIDARRGPVRAQQCKLRFRVVESGKLLP